MRMRQGGLRGEQGLPGGFKVHQSKLGGSLELVVQIHRERNVCWERN